MTIFGINPIYDRPRGMFGFSKDKDYWRKKDEEFKKSKQYRDLFKEPLLKPTKRIPPPVKGIPLKDLLKPQGISPAPPSKPIAYQPPQVLKDE